MALTRTLVMTLGILAGTAQAEEEVLAGVFGGPVSNIRYETPTQSGLTNEHGRFFYRPGETVTFSVGGLVLGTAPGRPRLNESHLVSRVNGNIDKLHDPHLVNLSRLLHTLDHDGLTENGVQLARQTHDAIAARGKANGMLALAAASLPVETFAQHATVFDLLADLNGSTKTFAGDDPRTLVTAAQARNQVRRNIRGIVKTTDVKIPMRDGAYLLADVFRPANSKRHPVIMNLGVYGKSFHRECICNEEDMLAREELEDRFFTGNPDGAEYENHETPDTSVWVPEGYIVIRVDGRGICNTPGQIDILSRQEAEDFYDAIEWAAAEPWSNGRVGLWGMSYYAINQHAVAALQPPGLEAMIPAATDADSYRDILYSGGIRNEEFITGWWNHASHAVCGDVEAKDFLSISRDNPFRDAEIYGESGEILISPNLGKVEVPQWITAPTTHNGHIHVGGSHQAFIESASEHKWLDITTDWFVNHYNNVPAQIAFFDYWLKDIDSELMQRPPVYLRVRTGGGAYYDRYEEEWPIARTVYTRFYLDASPTDWRDGRRDDLMSLERTPPTADASIAYSAEVDVGRIYPRRLGSEACWASGVSFVSDPMTEDMELAGFMKLGLWVSSSSSDMDIYASVRVLDENGREVDFSGPQEVEFADRANVLDETDVYPMGIGWLKVSHRKLDAGKTTDYKPVHTHLEGDYAPLNQDEVVPVEVALWPGTALIGKGHRIRLDIQPHDGCGHGSRHTYDASYHDGAENTLYLGPGRASYLQLPIVPARR